MFRKVIFKKFQKKIPRNKNVVALDLSNISGKKMSLMKFVLLSVTLKASSVSSVCSKILDCFCCAKKVACNEDDS